MNEAASGARRLECYFGKFVANRVQAASEIPVGNLIGREPAKHVRRRIAITADADAEPVKVEITSEGGYDAAHAIMAVCRAAKFGRERLWFVLERVVDDDHRAGEFGGVAKGGGDGWSGNVHERLYRR